MAREKTIAVRPSLRKLFPPALLRALARDSGAVVRERKVDVVALFWTLVLGFGVGESRTLAGLRRAYQRATGQCLEESSFYDRLNDGLVRLLKAALEHAFAAMQSTPRALRGPLAGFRDLLLTDATVIRVHALLAREFPGCRTNHTAAAVKLHTIMSVTGASRQSVRLTSERRHENRVLAIGEWIAGSLLVFDLGYYDFGLFSRISAQGGYFLSRLKDNANPIITALHRTHRGRAVEMVGQRLQDVLPRLKREVLDAEVTVTFSRRRYAGRRRREQLSLRLVAIRDPRTEAYHLYLSNIPPDQLPATDVQAVYASRWQIGVSSQGHIIQAVEVRPGLRDSGPVAWEAPWRESKTAKPSDNILSKEDAQRTRLQRAVNADVASSHAIPVAETVDNVRRQQGPLETSLMRRSSPAGYQRRHGAKDFVSTGEALDARGGKLLEERWPITVSGKWRLRHQGGGSGRSTVDGRAAKRARREGPGPVSSPFVKVRQG